MVVGLYRTKGQSSYNRKDGSEIVTSIRETSKKNVQHRMHRNTNWWQRLTQSELDEFKNIFGDYVKF